VQACLLSLAAGGSGSAILPIGKTIELDGLCNRCALQFECYNHLAAGLPS
jgi:hypothetical protein